MTANRLVVDTNVLISALLTPNGASGQVIKQLASTGASLLLSRLTFMELASRLAKPKFDRYRTPEQMERYLEWLAELAEWVKPSVRIDECRDPDDNRFLEVLITGEGHMLITGDSDLLVLHPYEGKPIITPAEFLASTQSGE